MINLSSVTDNKDVATKEYVDNNIPTKTSDLTNDSDYISSSALVSASTMTFVSWENSETATWENDAAIYPSGGGSDIPSQAGNAGKFLTTDGSDMSWANVTGLSPYTSNPTMNGVASAGSSSNFSRGDHIHPTDTSRAPLASPAFTGIPTAPTPITGAEDTQIATVKYVKDSVPTTTSQLTNNSNFVSDANYVHTDNNFTTTLKNKLNGIASGAEVNVNADWEAASGDAEILNKPTIPTKTSDLTNDSDFQTSSDVSTAIAGKLDISGGTMTGALTLSGAPTSDLEASTKKYVDDSISGVGSGLPSQSGNSGKFLTTDGTDASWANVPTPPSAYTSNPAMNGTASAGSSSNYAKGDHVHPTDTSRQAKITASGILKGDGSGGVSAAVSGTDYQSPLVAGTDYQTPLTFDDSPTANSSNPVKSGGVYTALGNKQGTITANGILKGNGSGTISAAVAGTDYQAPLTAGTDYQTPLVAGTDYQTPLPSQSGNNGKFLTTNGTTLSWGTAGSGLPSQSGNSGKFLTTDGTDASWGNIPEETFKVTYGTTTAAEIETAYQANKFIWCYYSGRVYVYYGQDSPGKQYLYASDKDTCYTIFCNGSTWSQNTTSLAKLDSPALTGTPTAPTAASGTNTTQIATTAFVQTATSGVIPSQSGNSGKYLTTDGSSLSWGTPSGGGDSNIFVVTYGTTTNADVEAAYQANKLIYCVYSGRIYTNFYRSSATDHYLYGWQGNTKYYVRCNNGTWSNSSSGMAPTSSPSLTGSPTATTATAGTNSTRIATTAFVTTAINNAITATLGGSY